MEPIRVLIVDDASAIRLLVSNALGAEPTVRVVGAAPNGQAALRMFAQLAPDVVLLDVEMPVMGGLETLAALRVADPRVPVIMFSSFTERGAAITVKALFLGASDYVAKPSARVEADDLRGLLVPKIHALHHPAARARPAAPAPAPPADAGKAEALVIGASTGGPAALATVLGGLGRPTVPVAVVQHMPPLFTKMLAETLTEKCGLPVREARGGEFLEPGGVWIAPGDYHLQVARVFGRATLRVHQGERENGCRPSVDQLFASAAAVYGRGALAVVLTGIGQDGLAGCQEIRRCGGRVVAQDEATSAVWGMPKAVADAALAEAVLPLEAIARHLVRALPARRDGGAALDRR
ncbi:MAG TPA: chemotaxis-specific protein-glutamate methyltransferase CheB [Polyangia bacterium]|nr:chemotaxis-specific protein-glutamate methyltransferase CheB [Polyangia bacterium]